MATSLETTKKPQAGEAGGGALNAQAAVQRDECSINHTSCQTRPNNSQNHNNIDHLATIAHLRLAIAQPGRAAALAALAQACVEVEVNHG